MNASNTDLTALAEEQILKAEEADYMNINQLEFFRLKLIKLYEITSARIDEAKIQMANPPEINDELDRASWEEECSIALRIVDREQKLLPKIKQSLERIRNGSYGYCLATEEPIGIPRLLVRPTAEYCTEVKADLEHKEHVFRG